MAFIPLMTQILLVILGSTEWLAEGGEGRFRTLAHGKDGVSRQLIGTFNPLHIDSAILLVRKY